MHVPRKRFGQHFLHDQSVIQHVLLALDAKPQDHVIEIGPGQGALTYPLLQQVERLEVIELDRDLISALQVHAMAAPLQVYAADALTFDFAALKRDERLLRIIGNLPYNISTPLIFHLLSFTSIIADMLFMLQKEVAHRLCAKANAKDYGRLSVMAQYHCQTELLFDVPASAFHPPPQVESTIIRMVPHRHYPHVAQEMAVFQAIVKQAFGQRRKTLRNSLKGLVDERLWSTVNICPTRRAENLSVKEFVELANAVYSLNASAHPGKLVSE